MAQRREAIAGVLLTTWGAAWIAAIAAAASPKGSLSSSLIHGASLLLLILGLICAIAGALVLRAISPDGTTDVAVFRIESSPVLEIGVLTYDSTGDPAAFLRTIHQVRITSQQPDARLVIDLCVRITMPDGRVFNEYPLDPRDPQGDRRELGWLDLPVEVEPQQTVIGTVGFTSFDRETVVESSVEFEATDLVSGASVVATLGEPRVATRRSV
jgi:hypothetical protein